VRVALARSAKYCCSQLHTLTCGCAASPALLLAELNLLWCCRPCSRAAGPVPFCCCSSSVGGCPAAGCSEYHRCLPNAGVISQRHGIVGKSGTVASSGSELPNDPSPAHNQAAELPAQSVHWVTLGSPVLLELQANSMLLCSLQAFIIYEQLPLVAPLNSHLA
jgi:hypothetical protein